MPDFERITDQIKIDTANTEAKKEYWQGYRDGKNQARFEVVWIVLCSFLFIYCYVTYSHW